MTRIILTAAAVLLFIPACLWQYIKGDMEYGVKWYGKLLTKLSRLT